MTKSEEEDVTIHSGSGEDNFSGNYNSLSRDNELFNDDDNVPAPVVSVRRVRLPHNGEDWEVLLNGKVTLLMKGTRFSTSEKEFLRTAQGLIFVINEYKNGFKSVVKIKEQMKKIIT